MDNFKEEERIRTMELEHYSGEAAHDTLRLTTFRLAPEFLLLFFLLNFGQELPF